MFSKNGFFRIPMSTSTHTRARLELEHARFSCYRLSAHLEDKDANCDLHRMYLVIPAQVNIVNILE